ncbi:glycosyltransferase family 2 protein [Methylobacter psychrophilus]|uniref:glycosyltransferase family 2 protein n=1 Tax=Methylobacter psychrophilus TaxID=96941 RepID=UPI0021D4D64E|nr:glycosyltransferase family 2 protein [Methylobacter psychrophilus]
MTNTLTVSIIIPTYRRLDILIQCLQGVYAMEQQPNQVLVIYRPDDDLETGRWLNEVACPAYSTLQLVPVFKPGQIAAMNAGLEIAVSDIITIIDDDAVPHPDWLSRLLPHFDDINVGAAGGRDIVDGHPPVKETTQAGYIDFWGNVIGNHHTVVGDAREVETIKGCNWAVRRSTLGTLHFDERLLGKGAQIANESWFCLNLRHQGWKIILDPNAIVDHYPAPQLDIQRGSWNKQKCYEQAYNVTATQLAYYPWHLKLRYFIFQLVVGKRYCPGVYYILHGLLKRPRVLPEILMGGWSGFFQGWQMAKEFNRNPPGIPNILPTT